MWLMWYPIIISQTRSNKIYSEINKPLQIGTDTIYAVLLSIIQQGFIE